MTRDEELALRKRQLAARKNLSGYERNLDYLRQRISELESE